MSILECAKVSNVSKASKVVDFGHPDIMVVYVHEVPSDRIHDAVVFYCT